MASQRKGNARSAGATSGATAVKPSNGSSNSAEQDIKLLDLLEHAREVGAVLLIPGANAYVDGEMGEVERRPDGSVLIRTAKNHYIIHGG